MQVGLVFLLLLGVSRGSQHEGFPILNPGGIGGIFKGPDSETIIRGPDGSQITSEQKGGSVVSDNVFASPIVVAEPEIEPRPIVAPLLTGEIRSSPEVEYISSPLPVDLKSIEIVQQDPHVIETEIVEAPEVEPQQSSDLKGPSGRIITKGSASIVSGPASTTITEPRKIIVVPPKISLESLHEQQLPVLSSTIDSLPVLVSTTASPPLVSYSTTNGAPLELRYSSTEALETAFDSSSIDLSQSRNLVTSSGDLASIGSIPEVDFSSSFGVVTARELPVAGGLYSSTELPTAASTVLSVTTGPAAPARYLVAPEGPAESTVQLGVSTESPNIQKIPKIEDSITADGRVDIGDYFSPKPSSQSPYQIPHVLSMALSKLYEKRPEQDVNKVAIDDKMGELTQNEIAVSTNQEFLLPPNLSRAKYIAPALEREGIDFSQISMAPVPLSQVTKIDPGYQSGYGRK